ncbi:type II toxin-antitoxin system HicA family toxin [Candidatus Marithioploca araucensis]|uniref:Type II toxin-antitoxin system HicA family toxin n=1 Tax=Candidatus Marithioploca araucensis TaxID=70273 RepID=A0ABT7VUD7_9GAMM|nr:type II toxin-antitoxin system HicA family toxin [Candidatus Marithioploca araucensis]
MNFFQVKKLLINLGFSEITIRKGSHIVFKNPSHDSIIVLPPFSPQRFVSSRHIAAIRIIIVENNILDNNKFNQLISV